MPDPTGAAYDLADRSGQRALMEQLLANPAFQESLENIVNDRVASQLQVRGSTEPVCRMSECPPANEGFSGIRQYVPQPFASNPGAADTCNVPLVMPPDGSLQATFTGQTTPMPYSTTDGEIYMFPGTVNGVEVYGFCVDHALPAPVGTFGNISIDQALSGQTQQTKRSVAFVIANVPRLPTDDAVDFFEMLGLPCAMGFNGYDARVIGRYVIYELLGQLSGGIAGLQFIDRPGYPPIGNAKADCLKQACQIFLEMATAFGYGTLDCGGSAGAGSGGIFGSGSSGTNARCSSTCGGGTCGGCGCAADNCNCADPCGLRLGCQIGKVYCCNTSAPVTDGSDTYLAFEGCANDLRECCGRVVLGPFKLISSNNGTPDLSLVPCNGCPGADIQVTDFCCNILAEPPSIGEEFYIAFRPPSCRYCFNLCATMETTSVAVYFFRESGNAAVQRQGLSFPRPATRTACIQVCIDITPEPPPPEPEPWWEHIMVNNNNNNNNNDNNDNNNSSNNSSLLNNLLSTLLNNMMSNNTAGSLFGGNFAGAGPGFFPPGGPFPPWPGGPFPPGALPPWPGGPFPPGPNPCGFPFPWKLFPPGTTPLPPPDCGGPNPCCCPPPCPPHCCCPPPMPPCPPPYPPWPPPCPPPSFLPYPYIPEPNFVIQPASLTYQAVPMPVPCFCPPPCPPMPQQQVYSPVTVVMPPSEPQQQPPAMFMPTPDPWVQYSAPPMPMQPAPFAPPMEPMAFQPPMPFTPPAMETVPLLPQFSGAPRPAFAPFDIADAYAYEQFYRDWYGE